LIQPSGIFGASRVVGNADNLAILAIVAHKNLDQVSGNVAIGTSRHFHGE
jgi:hypothetical protein